MSTSPADRSALRHRSINTTRISKKQSSSKDPWTTQANLPRASRTKRPLPQTGPVQAPVPRARHTARTRHQMMLVGIGMTLMLLILFAAQILRGWIDTKLDDLRYGYPRTFQMDSFVGQEKTGQPSHFIALNLKGQIEVIELPGANATQARIFLGPQLSGPGADLLPVTLQFVASRGSRTPDMYIYFQHAQIVFRNERGTFVADP